MPSLLGKLLVSAEKPESVIPEAEFLDEIHTKV
jgi:hypothetical protein